MGKRNKSQPKWNEKVNVVAPEMGVTEDAYEAETLAEEAEAVEAVAQAPEEVTEEAPKVVVKQESKKKSKVVVEDRSEYNCPTCKGLGVTGNLELANKHELCSQCGGTGKVA